MLNLHKVIALSVPAVVVELLEFRAIIKLH